MSVRVIVVLLLLSAAALPALAQQQPKAEPQPHERCSAEIQVCLDWMAEHYSGRGWVGMLLDVEGFRYTVTSVTPDSPAARGGIRPGDLLVAVNGVEFNEDNREKLLAMQDRMKPGAKFTYTVKRDGKRRNVDFVLVGMPLDVIAQMIGMHMLTDHVGVDVTLGENAD